MYYVFRQPALLIISWLVVLCHSLPVEGSGDELPPPLTPDNFATTITRGIWCIEFFSPHCGHCRQFAPTWAQLVAQNGRGEHGNWAQGHRGARLAQVDCALHGDLCHEMGVNGYPTISVFRDGKKEDTFKGDRSLDRLADWLKKWRDEDDGDDSKALLGQPTSSNKPKENPNPNGEVLKLTSATFSSFMESSTTPVFVKFFAPWCGHCKKLAPAWTSLAKSLKNRLTIAEVNCDDNGSLCKAQGVPGYPALMFYTAGGESKAEYSGSRKMEKMLEWVQRASEEPTKPIQVGDLEKYTKQENVIYVLLHGSESVLTHLKPLFTPLLGSPWVYTIVSPPPSIFSQYSLPSQARTSPFTLMAFKDNVTQPTSIYIHSASSSHSSVSIKPLTAQERENINNWLLTNRLPGSLELSQESWQYVMNAPQKPLVVMAAAEGEEEKKLVAVRMAELAMKWRLKTHGTGKVMWKTGGWSAMMTTKSALKKLNPWKKDGEEDAPPAESPLSEKEKLEVAGREVVFASMDLERWKDWLRTMYGIVSKGGDKDGLDSIPVAVVDHSALTYYHLAPSASAAHTFNDFNDDYSKLVPINLASSASVFAAITGAASGKIPKLHSENVLERFVRFLNEMLGSFESSIVSHPFRSTFMLLGVILLIITVIRRVLKEDVSYTAGRREWEKEKGRVD